MIDLFSGGVSVSYFAKKKGLKAICNDVLKINYFIAKGIIENKKVRLDRADVDMIFSGIPIRGFMYKNYANVLFFPKECEELDLYRKNIEKLPVYKKALALTLLRRAMVRKMPYSRFNLPWKKIKQLRDENYSYKKYGRKRSYHNETFKTHFLENLEEYNGSVFDNGKDNKAYNKDAFSLLGKIKADLVYLDPPYTGTMNNYFSFYGPMDEFIDSKKKRPFKNNFVDKQSSLALFDELFSQLKDYKYWVLSYNSGSYPNKSDLMNIIRKYSNDIKVLEKKHNYQLTGKKKKNENSEFLFIVRNHRK